MCAAIVFLIVIFYIMAIIQGLKIWAGIIAVGIVIFFITSILGRSDQRNKIERNKNILSIDSDSDYDIMVTHVNRIHVGYSVETANINDDIERGSTSKVHDLMRIASSSRLKYTDSYRNLLIPYENKQTENMEYIGLQESENELYQELITTAIEGNKAVYNRLDEIYGDIGGDNQRTILLNDAKRLLNEVRLHD